MATLTYNGESYTVDHAVQGTDYIHGYDADGCMVVSFEGVTSFDGFTYDGTYMSPTTCADEGCNKTLYVGSVLKTGDNRTVPRGNTTTTIFTNKTVAVSAWTSDTTYTNWGYRASVACTGVVATDLPYVVFDPDTAVSGRVASVAACYSGGVYIYAKEVPASTLTIPTIIIQKVLVM